MVAAKTAWVATGLLPSRTRRQRPSVMVCSRARIRPALVEAVVRERLARTLSISMACFQPAASTPWRRRSATMRLSGTMSPPLVKLAW